MEAYEKHGGNWDMIVEAASLERTSKQCQERYKRLKKTGRVPASTPTQIVEEGPQTTLGARIRQPTIMEQFAGSAAASAVALESRQIQVLWKASPNFLWARGRRRGPSPAPPLVAGGPNASPWPRRACAPASPLD